MTHLYRRCSKRGANQVSHPELRMHKFPTLAKNNENVHQIMSWAMFCYPTQDWFSLNALKGLQKSSKVVCSKHFADSNYRSSERIYLNKLSVPSIDEDQENIYHNGNRAGPSHVQNHPQMTPVHSVLRDHGNQGKSNVVASHALVFKIVWIRRRYKQPVAYYLSGDYVTADRLTVLIKEALWQRAHTSSADPAGSSVGDSTGSSVTPSSTKLDSAHPSIVYRSHLLRSSTPAVPHLTCSAPAHLLYHSSPAPYLLEMKILYIFIMSLICGCTGGKTGESAKTNVPLLCLVPIEQAGQLGQKSNPRPGSGKGAPGPGNLPGASRCDDIVGGSDVKLFDNDYLKKHFRLPPRAMYLDPFRRPLITFPLSQDDSKNFTMHRKQKTNQMILDGILDPSEAVMAPSIFPYTKNAQAAKKPEDEEDEEEIIYILQLPDWEFQCPVHNQTIRTPRFVWQTCKKSKGDKKTKAGDDKVGKQGGGPLRRPKPWILSRITDFDLLSQW